MTTADEAVPAALAGERVDRVAAIITGLSRSAVARLIEDGSILLDGRAIDTPSTRVGEGQRLLVPIPEPSDDRPIADPSVVVPVVHSDSDVIVVDKPAGMVVHPGAGHEVDTMVNGLLAIYPEIADTGDPRRPGVVHRLDRGTSGLLVVARTATAYDHLVAQMQRREPERAYAALVWGHPASDAGTIEAPVGRSTRHPTRMTVTERGRSATTRYAVERRYDEPRPCALLSCRLETGRTHQIRVHLQAIGHPVVGDRDYGGSRPGIELDRPFLHARELSFDHPRTGERVTFRSALPAELASVLGGLG